MVIYYTIDDMYLQVKLKNWKDIEELPKMAAAFSVATGRFLHNVQTEKLFSHIWISLGFKMSLS